MWKYKILLIQIFTLLNINVFALSRNHCVSQSESANKQNRFYSDAGLFISALSTLVAGLAPLQKEGTKQTYTSAQKIGMPIVGGVGLSMALISPLFIQFSHCQIDPQTENKDALKEYPSFEELSSAKKERLNVLNNMTFLLAALSSTSIFYSTEKKDKILAIAMTSLALLSVGWRTWELHSKKALFKKNEPIGFYLTPLMTTKTPVIGIGAVLHW